MSFNFRRFASPIANPYMSLVFILIISILISFIVLKIIVYLQFSSNVCHTIVHKIV